LFYLDLAYTEMTDASVPELQKLTKLAFIDVRETRITDVGEKAIKDGPKPKKK